MELCLGTAQLGMSYGINSEGKPAYFDSIEILNEAYSKSICFFDTASLYGNSENIIGDFIKEEMLEDKIFVITKAQNTDQINPYDSIKLSLDKLKLDHVEGFMIHEVKNMYDKLIVRNMKDIKARGLARNLGVSIYKTEDAIYAANQDWVDYIQIPYNVFDHRLDATSFFEIAKENDKKIFARSPFLQGLLLMNSADVIKKLPYALKEISLFNKIINKYKFNNLEVALEFVKANTYIDYLVFGVDNIFQLGEIIASFTKCLNNDEMILELKKAFKNIDDKIIMPNMW